MCRHVLVVFCVIAAGGEALSQGLATGGTEPNLVAGNTVSSAGNAGLVDANDAVLSVQGACALEPDSGRSHSAACVAIVKRQDFENLLTAMVPGKEATPALRRSVANIYADLLAFQEAAIESGVDATPKFRERMQLLRLRTLADLYRRNLETESSTVSDQEVHSYYATHISDFEEVKLRRMLLPRNNFSLADKQEFERKALEIATAFRERAASGEDLDQLQKQAYLSLGFDATPPTTDVGTRRRAGLSPEASTNVFALNPGEVSRVEKESYSFVFYKVEAKWTVPEKRVRDEIVREISKEKLEAALKAASDRVTTVLDPRYFGEPAAK